MIYKTNIAWVEELTLTKDVQIGEIKTINDANTDFKDEMSNKLPVGTKIFSTKERGDILIVESKGEIKKISCSTNERFPWIRKGSFFMKKVRLFSENSANFNIIYLNGILKFFQFHLMHCNHNYFKFQASIYCIKMK